MKYSIDELKAMYQKNESEKEAVKGIINSYNEKCKNIDNIQKDILKKINEASKVKTEKENISRGVIIDYKLFSEVLGVLTTAKQCNLCTEEFFNKIVQAGKDSESKKDNECNESHENRRESYKGCSKITMEPVNPVNDEKNEESMREELADKIIKQAILNAILSGKIRMI